MPRFEQLGLPAPGGGRGDLVAEAVELLKQRQLGAYLDLLPPHQDPHILRPAVEAVTAGALTQQPGQLGDLRVLAGPARGVQRRGPPVGRHLPDCGAHAFVEAEPDRIGHRPARPRIQFRQMVDHVVAGTGAVDGDQQILAPLRRDGGDRGVDDRDVIDGRVGAGVALARNHRQQLAGVVAERQQRVKAIPALEVPCRAFLVAVRVDQRGVDADHDHVAEIPVAGARRRDRTVARLDQLPHPPANLVAHQRDPGQTRVVDLVERPPQCRCGDDRPEQPGLIAQHRRPGQVLRTTSDRDRYVADHRAPVVGHLRPRQRPRQAAG